MEISSVKLRNTYQIYYIDTNNIFVKPNSLCVVETSHGIDLGKVSQTHRDPKNNKNLEINGKLLRKAKKEDLDKIPEIEDIEKKAFESCKEKAAKKKLKMKLVSVKCIFDKTKIIFYFVAENRIDFRELVRELAAVFRTRIEMRQIGVRDEARLVKGYGPCGRPFCCQHQRNEFAPVSIKMAKEQNLNLNSLKISGMCGRLLCCLGYEYDVYRELNKNLPKHGMEILIGNDRYRVYSSDPLTESFQIKIDERIIAISKNDVTFKDKKYRVSEAKIKELLDYVVVEETEEDDIYKIQF